MEIRDQVIDIVHGMPADVSLSEIIKELRSRPELHFAEQEMEYDDGEVTDDEWREFVAHSLRDELADSRQDIYTLEDGVPYDVAG